MKITFLGAAKTVTGSCFLVETDSAKFLVDCGMFQGRSKENAQNEEPFPFNVADISFILLTHAHIDHSGRIPKLYKDGFKGDVITTKATAELCGIMLPDSGHIQEFENEWTNRKRLRAGKPPVEPLYTLQDAVDCMELFKSVRYGELIKPAKDIRVRFNDAGHMLGSSIIEVWVTENGSETKVVFTGDLGNSDMPILRDPTIIDSADYLIIESTYGNRLHKEKNNRVETFVDITLDTLKKGGNVIIPSFAVGRTQEIIYDINEQHSIQDKKLKELLNTPVFVDSPLAISATEIFRRNLDCYDEEAREYIENGDNPLDFPGLKFTRTADESRALNERTDSSIIISASGMCEAGRIKHHLKHNLWRKDSTILFVGYQAQGTLGRRLVDGAKKVRIFGEEISVKARIEVIEGYSGHADRNGLLNWIKRIEKKPVEIFIVHGEEGSMLEFSDFIIQETGIKTVIPSRGETYTLEAGVIVESADKEYSIAESGRFLRLEIVDMLDKLKEEYDDIYDMIIEDLKQQKNDSEIKLLKTKLTKLEKMFIDIIA
ncbi:MAG: MBL fold metallo-hydrolase RNA specificity domain-containing protein [Acetivibrionales bacterium]|jgi:metallo-beta-lactamase family protein